MGKMCYCCMTPGVENGKCRNCGQPELPPNSNGNALPLGTKLGHGRLTVGKKLGSGGFGVTYIAYDHKLERRVALKEFMPDYLAVRNGVRIQPKPNQTEAYIKAMNSFLKEARALYELRFHPNIVHVFSVVEENNTAFYTMEFLKGESLLSYMKKQKKISGDKAFRMLYPVMDAINYAHNRGILHRDISPDNIMLCEVPSKPGHLVPKLIDFGAAHVAIEGFSVSYPGVKKNGYSPLEQNWKGDTQGAWTDVYALCATFYSAVAGGVPISAEQRAAEEKDPLVPPSQLGGEISPKLEAVLMRGLKLRYQDRIQSMAKLMREMNDAIRDDSHTTVMESLGYATVAPKRPVGRRVGAWLIEQALLMVCQAGVMYYLLSQASRSLLGLMNILRGDGLLLITMVPVMLFVLNLILLMTVRGTLGQLIFGIRVKDGDGYANPSFSKCLIYAFFYDGIIQMICGIVWLASGKNLGPIEYMLNLNVIVSNAGAPAVENGNGVIVVSNPVSRRKEINHAQQKPAISTKTATLICMHATDELYSLVGKSIQIHDGDTLGQSREKVQIAILDHTVSRLHCSFHYRESGWFIRDEGSRNGTYIEQIKLPEYGTSPLKQGIQIKVGKEIFRFVC